MNYDGKIPIKVKKPLPRFRWQTTAHGAFWRENAAMKQYNLSYLCRAHGVYGGKIPWNSVPPVSSVIRIHGVLWRENALEESETCHVCCSYNALWRENDMEHGATCHLPAVHYGGKMPLNTVQAVTCTLFFGGKHLKSYNGHVD